MLFRSFFALIKGRGMTSSSIVCSLLRTHLAGRRTASFDLRQKTARSWRTGQGASRRVIRPWQRIRTWRGSLPPRRLSGVFRPGGGCENQGVPSERWKGLFPGALIQRFHHFGHGGGRLLFVDLLRFGSAASMVRDGRFLGDQFGLSYF